MWDDELDDVPVVLDALDHLDIALLSTDADDVADTATVRTAAGLAAVDDADPEGLIDRVTTIDGGGEHPTLRDDGGIGRQVVGNEVLGLDEDDDEDDLDQPTV